MCMTFFFCTIQKNQFMKDILFSFFNTLEVNEDQRDKMMEKYTTKVLYSYDSNLFKNLFRF